ncbi:MAG: enolase C-terminal domain-like protein, partial [Pseudomonadota bacterium]
MTAPTAPLAQTITSLDLWHLSLPVRSRRDHGIGTVAGAVEVVIVRLTAEDGTEGYGEASPWSVFTGTTENAYSAIDRYMRPFIVGTRVDELAATMRGVERAVAFSTDAKAAVETALLDLTGRIAGVPLYTLLGGVFRREVPLSVSLADPDFDADLAFAERLAGEGIGIVKLKAGVSDHAFDMMRLEALRQRFPAFDVRVDYNQGLSPDEAMAR